VGSQVNLPENIGKATLTKLRKNSSAANSRERPLRQEGDESLGVSFNSMKLNDS
jgi:hypothetical protein